MLLVLNVFMTNVTQHNKFGYLSGIFIPDDTEQIIYKQKDFGHV
jgi:hypothetical protein